MFFCYTTDWTVLLLIFNHYHRPSFIIYLFEVKIQVLLFEAIFSKVEYTIITIIYFTNFLFGHLDWLPVFHYHNCKDTCDFLLLVQSKCTLLLRLLIHIAKLFPGKSNYFIYSQFMRT